LILECAFCRDRTLEAMRTQVCANQYIDCTVVLFAHTSYYLRSDFPSHESRGDFPVKGFVEVIVPLSKADFDRSVGLADQIRQPELKLHMKLLAIQAATSE
jgi:hypothetical protein